MRQNLTARRVFRLAAACAAACGWVCASLATAQTYTVLHSFASPDGANPEASLVQASDGYFYGTTSSGGDGGVGTVFRIDTSGNLTTLHSFTGTDGANPAAPLIQATDGLLYGTTKMGGASGDGTVFQIDAAGSTTTIHSFGGADGAHPIAGLVEGVDGFLYGTTFQGGASGNCPGGCGTVFRVDTAGNLTTLYSFEDHFGGDEADPAAGLIQAGDSNLYGTTRGDLDFTIGNVFKIDLSGNLTVLHSFNGFDGSEPKAGLVQGSDGYLYGTTSWGPYPQEMGTVFRIDTSGHLWRLHTFSVADGTHPEAALLQARNGSFYGTTTQGGSSGHGTIFQIDPSGSFAVLHAFSGSDGSGPTGGLVKANDGNLYGTAAQGGASGQGVVFVLQLPGCVVNPAPVITPSGTTTFCAGGSVTLDAGPGYSAYLWSPGGQTTESILVATSGNFTVNVTDTDGCTGTSAPAVVTVNPNPVPVITPSGPTTFCAGGSVTLDAGAGYASYYWLPGGQTTRSIVVTTSGNFTVNVSDANGCAGTSTPTVVTVNPDPAPVLTTNLCIAQNTAGLTASVSAQAGNTYVWTLTGGTIDSGQGTSTISFTSGSPGTSVTMSVAETNAASCTGTANLVLQVDYSDVPSTDLFYPFVCAIGRNGMTAGCGGGDYCPDNSVTRAQMAVLLLKGEHGPTFVPPACSTTVFADEPCPGGLFVDWVNQLEAEGITGGCGGGNYCPADPVLRQQMAVFLLKAQHGASYVPPTCTGIFADVSCPGQFADWIEALATEGVTAGCGGGNYCPGTPNTRGQMAVFLVKAFGLPLYGP